MTHDELVRLIDARILAHEKIRQPPIIALLQALRRMCVTTAKELDQIPGVLVRTPTLSVPCPKCGHPIRLRNEEMSVRCACGYVYTLLALHTE